MCCKRYHIIFSTFSLKFKCKICVQKEVIHNFKNHILVTWPATNLLILRKWCGFEKPNHYYYPLIVFRRQNHITFTFIKSCHMTSLYKWPILAWSVFSPFSRVIGSRNKAGLTVNIISCHGNRPWICAHRLLNNPKQFSIGHSWAPNTLR